MTASIDPGISGGSRDWAIATASSCASGWQARCNDPKAGTRVRCQRAGCAGPNKFFRLAPTGVGCSPLRSTRGGQRSGMVDYSYRRPSRRAESTPSVIMPTLERPVPDVAIVCDTSGSMTGTLLARVLSEVEALLQRVGLRGTKVRVLSCDAQVHTVKRVSRASQIDLLGGGGTDMGEGITQALALRPRPSHRRRADRRLYALAHCWAQRCQGDRRLD